MTPARSLIHHWYLTPTDPHTYARTRTHRHSLQLLQHIVQTLFDTCAGLWKRSIHFFQKCMILLLLFISLLILRILLFILLVFLEDVPWRMLSAVFKSPSDEYPPLILLWMLEDPLLCLILAPLRWPPISRNMEDGTRRLGLKRQVCESLRHWPGQRFAVVVCVLWWCVWAGELTQSGDVRVLVRKYRHTDKQRILMKVRISTTREGGYSSCYGSSPAHCSYSPDCFMTQ